MAGKLKPALEQSFDLPKTDALLENVGDTAEASKVTIVQATMGQHDKRMALWAEFKRSVTEDVNGKERYEVTQNVSPADVRKLEVLLTMRACNLEDHDGSPLFKFPLEERPFNKAWAKLPPLVADEIHEKVLALNPLWSGDSGEDE